MGIAVADYDNDGDPDFCLTTMGSNLLFRNNGDGTFSGALRDSVAPTVAEFGIEPGSVGVKDVGLPGEVKRMLSQEEAAERAGCAALIAARSETATTRNLVNAARLLAENPALMRLREFQSLAEVAREPGNTVVLTLPHSPLAAPAARESGRDREP